MDTPDRSTYPIETDDDGNYVVEDCIFQSLAEAIDFWEGILLDNKVFNLIASDIKIANRSAHDKLVQELEVLDSFDWWEED